MMWTVDLPPVVTAVAASMVLGAVWYSPFALGKQWMDAANVSEKKFRETNMTKLLGLQFVLSSIIAVLLQAFLRRSTADTFLEGAEFVLPLWVLISAVQAMHTMYEGGRWKLIALTSAHEFFNILLMGGVLAAWR